MAEVLNWQMQLWQPEQQPEKRRNSMMGCNPPALTLTTSMQMQTTRLQQGRTRVTSSTLTMVAPRISSRTMGDKIICRMNLRTFSPIFQPTAQMETNRQVLSMTFSQAQTSHLHHPRQQLPELVTSMQCWVTSITTRMRQLLQA